MSVHEIIWNIKMFFGRILGFFGIYFPMPL